MYQFTIHLPPERVQALIERDCVQRRHAPGYWGKDYRAVLMMHSTKKLPHIPGRVPGFIFNYYRYFRYELTGQGNETGIRGKFVFPIHTQLLPFLHASIFLGLPLATYPKMFLSPPALCCLTFFVCAAFLIERTSRKSLPKKEYKKEQETDILTYFARLARTYSAEPSDADVAGEEPPVE